MSMATTTGATDLAAARERADGGHEFDGFDVLAVVDVQRGARGRRGGVVAGRQHDANAQRGVRNAGCVEPDGVDMGAVDGRGGRRDGAQRDACAARRNTADAARSPGPRVNRASMWGMDYELIIKFWRASLTDEAVIATIERELQAALGAAAQTDGYDTRAKDINLFIRTADPRVTFRKARA